MARETVIFVKVANKKAERTGKFALRDFGQEKEFSKAVMNDPEWRKTFGALGLMTKEDYEAGRYAGYGIKESDVQRNVEVESLNKTIEEQQRLIAELKAQSAGKEEKKEVEKPAKVESAKETIKTTEKQ